MKTAAHLTAAAERGLHRDGTHRLRRAFSKVATTALLAGALLILAPIGQGVAITTLDNLFIHLKTPLEKRFARPPEGILLGITGIVILGGSYSRIDEAARIAALLPHSRVILTGAGLREETRLARRGVNGPRLTIERNATSTYENAVYARRVAAPRADERWLLVTSAVHMPRAIGAFRAAGFPIEAWPV